MGFGLNDCFDFDQVKYCMNYKHKMFYKIKALSY